MLNLNTHIHTSTEINSVSPKCCTVENPIWIQSEFKSQRCWIQTLLQSKWVGLELVQILKIIHCSLKALSTLYHLRVYMFIFWICVWASEMEERTYSKKSRLSTASSQLDSSLLLCFSSLLLSACDCSLSLTLSLLLSLSLSLEGGGKRIPDHCGHPAHTIAGKHTHSLLLVKVEMKETNLLSSLFQFFPVSRVLSFPCFLCWAYSFHYFSLCNSV